MDITFVKETDGESLSEKLRQISCCNCDKQEAGNLLFFCIIGTSNEFPVIQKAVRAEIFIWKTGFYSVVSTQLK